MKLPKKTPWILCALLTLALGTLFLSGPPGVRVLQAASPTPAAPTVAPAPPASSSRGGDVFTGNPVAQIAKRSSPAVVNIDTETLVRQSMAPFPDDPFFRQFFGQELERFSRTVPMKGKGSGFLVSKDGTILTNNHVVEGADKITVTLLDGRHFPAKLVGRDPTFDLAVVKIQADKLPALPLGDSERVEVGEWVVAIGNPFGLENTVTVGVLSAKNRTIQAQNLNFQGFLQTDAAINPGNSGGPLLNLRGEVVGINTAIVPYAQGIGFAVPVNMAKQVMDDLIRHGEVKRGWMGVSVQSLTPAFAEAYGIPTAEGAVVGDVVPGSPADRAGLARGDVIVSLGGKAVKNSQDVVFAVRNFLAGDKVKLEFYRQKTKRSVEVVLGDLPGKGEKKAAKGSAPSAPERTSSRLGAAVSGVTPELRSRYKLPGSEGVVVLSVEGNSFAQMLGLRPGDLVLEANRRRIRGVPDWEAALGGKPKAVALLVWREGQTLFFSLKAE